MRRGVGTNERSTVPTSVEGLKPGIIFMRNWNLGIKVVSYTSNPATDP